MSPYPSTSSLFQTKIHVLRRDTGEVTTTQYVTETFFFLHTINAYEDHGHIVLDIAAYKNADMLNCMFVEALKVSFLRKRIYICNIIYIFMKPGVETSYLSYTYFTYHKGKKMSPHKTHILIPIENKLHLDSHHFNSIFRTPPTTQHTPRCSAGVPSDGYCP